MAGCDKNNSGNGDNNGNGNGNNVGDKELSGNITINPTTATVGTTLTSVYSGNETVSYQWKKGGSNISGGTSKTYKANEKGDYAVTVSATGYKSKTSSAVTVTESGGGGGIDFTFELKAGNASNEVIVVCNPRMPALPVVDTIYQPSYLITNDGQPPFEYNQTGGNAARLSKNTSNSKWNAGYTEYTYAFNAVGGQTWEGTVTLTAIDQDGISNLKSSLGIKTVTIVKNNPVSVKVGD